MTDAERLIAQIEEAFAGVTLDDGLSLNECEYADSYDTADEFLERAKQDERHDWHKVINDELRNYHVTFAFTDVKGYRFYLPAYMVWTIRNLGSTEIIGDFTIYACSPDKHQFWHTPFHQCFSRKQRLAIEAFLEFCAAAGGGTMCDANVARHNLRRIQECREANRGG